MRQGLSAPFRVIKLSLTDWWRDWVRLVAVNLAWVLLLFTIVLGPPATFIMYRLANTLVHGRDIYLHELPALLRRYFLKSWLWLLPSLFLVTGVWVNFQFYSRLDRDWGIWLRSLSVLVGAFWLALQFYALPYLMEQDRLSLRQAYRNALFTTLASPFYSLVILGLSGLVAAACLRFAVLFFLGAPSFIAVLGSRAVVEQLKNYGIRDRSSGTP